jgi:hypothetical protein
MWQMTASNYTLRFNANNFDLGITAFVQDTYLNTEMPMNMTSSTDVNFTITSDVASANANRFRIVFRTSNALPVTVTNLKAYQQNAGVQVEWQTLNETNMGSYQIEKSADATLFTKSGTVVASGLPDYNWFDASPVKGNNYYRIKMLDKNGGFKYTQVVNVKIGGGSNVFTVVGNPVKGNMLVLQLENVDMGSYTVSIYNNLGQRLFSNVIMHNGGSATQTLKIGNIATGAYQLNITGNNVKTTKSIIID